jgi:hypothetical protein
LYGHISLEKYDISGTKKSLGSRAFRICITLGAANEVLALKKITFHPKLVKISTICLPENIIGNSKKKLAKSFA